MLAWVSINQIRAARCFSLEQQDFFYLRSPIEIEFQSSWPRLKHSATSTVVDYLNCDYCRVKEIYYTIVNLTAYLHFAARQFKVKSGGQLHCSALHVLHEGALTELKTKDAAIDICS